MASDVVSWPMIIRAMALGLAQKPDLIVLTGDFWTDRHEAITDFATVLRVLPRLAPTLAVVGNRYGGRWVGGAPRII